MLLHVPERCLLPLRGPGKVLTAHTGKAREKVKIILHAREDLGAPILPVQRD
jgi:hypothetical protein